MKILVTGSNGLLGQKLLKLLTDRGETVIATAPTSNRVNYLDKEFDFHVLDITDEDQVNQVLERVQPDVVINTAAMTNVDQCETDQELCRKLNVDSVSYLSKACGKLGAFLIHLSTDFIFDGNDGPYAEEDQPNPISFYGQSKLDAEEIVRSSEADWAIVRTVLVYGITPGMSRSNIILWVKGSLESGKKLNIVDDQWRTPTLAEDLAMGCYLIAQKKAQGIYNISGSEMLTPFDMAMLTCDHFGLDKSLISKVDGSTFSQPAKRPPKTGFVLNKARRVLGYAPTPFAEGIQILDEQAQQLAQ